MINKVLLFLNITFLRIFRPKFKQWTILQDKQANVYAEIKNKADISLSVFDYLKTAFLIPVDYSALFWKDVLFAFIKIVNLLRPTDKPILNNNTFEENTMPWDYFGRTWYFFLHLFAKNYGWSERKIASLNVDDAVSLLQEILVDEQLEKEFYWQLSDISYKYDSATKKSTLIRLPRPAWMTGTKQSTMLVKVKIPVNLMPTGVVINLMDNNETKKTFSN
jgi:hypothetical protein